jgi:hypothetical protein
MDVIADLAKRLKRGQAGRTHWASDTFDFVVLRVERELARLLGAARIAICDVLTLPPVASHQFRSGVGRALLSASAIEHQLSPPFLTCHREALGPEIANVSSVA